MNLYEKYSDLLISPGSFWWPFVSEDVLEYVKNSLAAHLLQQVSLLAATHLYLHGLR